MCSFISLEPFSDLGSKSLKSSLYIFWHFLIHLQATLSDSNIQEIFREITTIYNHLYKPINIFNYFNLPKQLNWCR